MCRTCGCVENTALGGYWVQELAAYEEGRPSEPLCSECNPSIGAWHGRFPKKSAAGYVQNRSGHLYRPEEVNDSITHLGPFFPVELPKVAS